MTQMLRVFEPVYFNSIERRQYSSDEYDCA